MPSRSAVLSSSALAIEDPSSEVGKRSRLDGLSGNRAKRVVGLVLGVTAVSLLDLLLTMREAERSCFVEANPVAAAVLDGSVVSPGLFKGVLLFAGMVTLFALRRRR